MNGNFGFYSKYYDLLYADKNYNEETEYICHLIKKYRPETKSILELGSGTGIHGSLFQSKGFDVFGLERSEGMVNEARRRGFPSQVADICDFHLDRSFDCIISLFHVISYLTDNKSLVNTFQNANVHLKNNGLFIFDLWYSPAVYKQQSLPRIKRMENKQLKLIRFSEPFVHTNRNVIDVKFTLIAKDLEVGKQYELEEIHPMRHFSIPEIDLLSQLTGFKILAVEEFISQKEPSFDSWGICFVLQKINS